MEAVWRVDETRVRLYVLQRWHHAHKHTHKHTRGRIRWVKRRGKHNREGKQAKQSLKNFLVSLFLAFGELFPVLFPSYILMFLCCHFLPPGSVLCTCAHPCSHCPAPRVSPPRPLVSLVCVASSLLVGSASRHVSVHPGSLVSSCVPCALDLFPRHFLVCLQFLYFSLVFFFSLSFPAPCCSAFDFCILDFGFQLYLIYLVIPPTCLCLWVYVTFGRILLPPSSLISSKFEHDACLVNARIIMFGRPLRNPPLLAGFGPFFGLLSLDLVFKIWLSVQLERPTILKWYQNTPRA